MYHENLRLDNKVIKECKCFKHMYEICCLVNPNCNTKYEYYYKPNEIHIINIVN